VLLSENLGGAKLEFLTQIHHDTEIAVKEREDGRGKEVIVSGVGSAKGRKASITSSYPGALFVFEQHLANLVNEEKRAKEKSTAPSAARFAR
jgi:hypothetical protein